MSLEAIKAGELRNKEPAEIKEIREDLRRQIAELRINVLTASAKETNKLRLLKRSLARVLTVTTEKNRAKNKKV